MGGFETRPYVPQLRLPGIRDVIHGGRYRSLVVFSAGIITRSVCRAANYKRSVTAAFPCVAVTGARE